MRLQVMYGHLEGGDVGFARDPSGYFSIEAGIYARHGLEVSWDHVQGTEERYRRLESGEAQISFVVGRASLQHFLDTRSTRLLGCAMNSCPYYLVAAAVAGDLKGLKGKIVVCREGPARGVPFENIFAEHAGLKLNDEVNIQFTPSDQRAFDALVNGRAHAAIVPRPYAFMAEARGFHRLNSWPDAVDDPLPITIETTAALAREREKDFHAFIAAHREGIRYFKTDANGAARVLRERFGHSPAFAAKTVEEYFVWMDDSLTLDFKQFERLLSQVAPEQARAARWIASEWVIPGALSG